MFNTCDNISYVNTLNLNIKWLIVVCAVFVETGDEGWMAEMCGVRSATSSVQTEITSCLVGASVAMEISLRRRW